MRALRPAAACAVLVAAAAVVIAPPADAAPAAATLRAGGYAFTVPHANTVNATVRVPRLSCGSASDPTLSIGVYGTYVAHRTSTGKHGSHHPRYTPHLWSLAVIASCRAGAAHDAVVSRGYGTTMPFTLGTVHPGDVVQLSATPTSWTYETTGSSAGVGAAEPPNKTVAFRPHVVAGVRLVDARSVHLHTLLSGVTGNGRRLGTLHPHRATQRRGGRVVVLPGAIRADRTSFPVRVR